MTSIASLVRIALLSVVLEATTRSGAAAGDWPTFRGPQRTAVSAETGLLQSWPEGGPKLLWEAKGAGRGYASLAIAGNFIVTLGDGPSSADDDKEYLIAFNRATGKILWKLKAGEPWAEGSPTWQSSRSTPTIDGNSVYALTAFGDLICADLATGKLRWRLNLKDDLSGQKADKWGYSESPTVDGDRLIVTPGGPQNTMVALDKKTGKKIWSASHEGNIGAAHSSIVVTEVDGTRVYVQTTGSGPIGVRAADGKLLWSYPMEKTTAVAPTPIVRGDLVFFAAGYRRGGALLKQIPKPGNLVEVEEIYPVNTDLANKHGGIVLVGDYLYGDSDDKGIPFCADLMTGERKWQSRGSGSNSAAIAAADGRLYIHFADGTMVLAKASPEAYEETGKFTVPGSGERPSWSHPVILDGKLYLREQDVLTCYDVRAGK